MDQYCHFCILKSYKGIFKKRHVGNSNILITPISKNETIGFVILGHFEDMENDLAMKSILRAPILMTEAIVNDLSKQYKEDFIIVEKIKVVPKEKSKGNYFLKMQKKGKYLKSNYEITFEPEYSSNNQLIYRLNGNLELVTEEKVTQGNINMISKKIMAKARLLPKK